MYMYVSMYTIHLFAMCMVKSCNNEAVRVNVLEKKLCLLKKSPFVEILQVDEVSKDGVSLSPQSEGNAQTLWVHLVIVTLCQEERM